MAWIFVIRNKAKNMKPNIILKIDIHINETVSKVWDALTRPEIIKQYFFGTDTDTDWKPGSPIRFSGEWQGKTYEDKGIVLENEPNQLLSYDYWSSMSGLEDKPENYATVSYQLRPDGKGTYLSVIQENIKDEKNKEHAAINWKKVLESLKILLENKF